MTPPGLPRDHGARPGAAPGAGRRLDVASDVAARARAASDLDTTFLVEASAGTGKTSLLVERILSILARGRATLREIVAITFTEKAAGELRLRLQRRLEEEAAHGREEEATRGRWVQDALADLPLAPISTIHAFAASLLSERPVEARLDPATRVADELESRVLLAEAWREWQESAFSRADPDLSRALALGFDPNKLWETVQLLVAHRDVLQEFSLAPEGEGGATREHPPIAQEFLERQLVPALEQFMTSLPARMEACRDPADRGYQQMRELLRSWAGADRTFPGAARGHGGRAGIEAWLWSSPLPGPAGNQRAWDPPATLVAYKDDLRRVAELQKRYGELRRHEIIAGVVERLKDFLVAYEERRRERGVLDFQDLLLRARNLLREDRETRGYFQERFKFILVDEFQDTDPLQAEMVFFLAERQPMADEWRYARLVPGKLFLVGDPKQSIYRFRRADIEVYDLARQAVLGQEAGRGEVLVLSRNFRATTRLLDWVNHTFEALIRAEEGERIQPSYSPLHPSEKSGDMPGEVRLLAPSARRRELAGETLRVAVQARLEAELVAGSIRSLVAGRAPVMDPEDKSPRPVRYADMALLLGATTHVEAFEQEFARVAIPYRLFGGKSFYRRAETHTLVSLLRAIEYPHDTVSVVAALKSPAFGLSDEALLVASRAGALTYLASPRLPAGQGDAAKAALQTLRDFHALRNQIPLATFLEQLLRETHLLEVFYLLPQGEQRVANVRKIVEMARRLDREGPVPLRRFVREISDLLAEEAAEAEPVSLEEGEDAVRILTIHRAKGLEFPVVFLANLAGREVADQRWPELVADRRSRVYALGLAKDLTTLGHADLHAYEMRCARAEECRLLYVAATRARNYLYLVHPRPATVKGQLALLHPFLPLADDARPGDLVSLGGPWNAVIRLEDESVHPPLPSPGRWAAWPPADAPVSAEALAEDAGREAAWRRSLAAAKEKLRPRIEVIHPSALKADLAEELAAIGHAAAAPAGTARDRGALVGSLVHEVLAQVFDLEEEDAVALLAARGRSERLTADEGERAKELLRRALGSPLVARARRAPRVLTEIAFVRPVTGREADAAAAGAAPTTLVEGRIDLLFEEGDHLVLVDYKTDAVRAGEELRERAATYREGLAEYRRSVEALTGRRVEALFYFLETGEEVHLEEAP